MKKGNSLKKQMLTVVVLPLLLMVIMIVGISVSSLVKASIQQSNDSLVQASDLVMEMYDVVYPGYFFTDVNMEQETYSVLKGGVDVTNDYSIIDAVKETLDVDVIIYCMNTSVLTSLCNDEGERYINIQAPYQVQIDVFNNKQSKLYTNVDLAGEPSNVYYVPLYQENGDRYGMMCVCNRVSDVKGYVYTHVVPIALACLCTTLLVGVIIISFTSKLVARITKLDKFLTSVAKGDFDADLSSSILSKEDEITSLARNSRTMNDSMRKLVEFDALTSLHNRRYGNKRILEIMSSSERQGTPFCVAMCDIDFFKKVNDTYGHEAGDEILKAVAAKLSKGMGSNGFVSRWGGEEFLLVFASKQLDEASSIMQGILDEIRAMETTFENQVIKVTMSMGVVTGSLDISAEENIKLADENLYYAKEHGRNQIIAGELPKD